MPEKSVNDQIPPGFKLRHTLRGHEGKVYKIAWSPDGWTLEGHRRTVNSVAWTPEG